MHERTLPGRADVARSEPAVQSIHPFVPLAVGLVVWTLGLFLAPSVYGGWDAAEITLALATLGVVHPPGYPLFVLAGHPFVRLVHALGAPWPYAANLWSAAGAAVAAALLWRLGAALLECDVADARRRAVLALVPVVLVGLNPVWLNAATQAEVHSWHAAWCAGAMLFAWRIADGSAPTVARTAWLWGLIVGAGLAHRPTSLLFSLPLTAVVGAAWARRGALTPRRVAACAAGVVLPLAGYAFIAARALHPAPGQWPLLEPGLAGLWHHATAGIYGLHLGGFEPGAVQLRYIRLYLLPVLVPGLGLLAWRAFAERPGPRRALLRALAAGAVLQIGFVGVYAVPDPAANLIPLLLVATVAIVLVPGPRAGAWPAPAVAAAALVVACVAAAIALPLAVRTRDGHRDVDAAIRARWTSIPYEPAIVVWKDDWAQRLVAYQVLEQSRPGLVVVNPTMLTWPAGRRRFEARMGFDPVAGMTLDDPSDVDRIAANLRRLSRIPVVEFERR